MAPVGARRVGIENSSTREQTIQIEKELSIGDRNRDSNQSPLESKMVNSQETSSIPSIYSSNSNLTKFNGGLLCNVK